MRNIILEVWHSAPVTPVSSQDIIMTDSVLTVVGGRMVLSKGKKIIITKIMRFSSLFQWLPLSLVTPATPWLVSRWWCSWTRWPAGWWRWSSPPRAPSRWRPSIQRTRTFNLRSISNTIPGGFLVYFSILRRFSKYEKCFRSSNHSQKCIMWQYWRIFPVFQNIYFV